MATSHGARESGDRAMMNACRLKPQRVSRSAMPHPCERRDFSQACTVRDRGWVDLQPIEGQVALQLRRHRDAIAGARLPG